MRVTRRDFLKASSFLAAAWGLRLPSAVAGEGVGPTVVWLNGAGCSGCSVSLLNTIYYMTIDRLLTQTIDLQFHPTIMAGAGATARDVALALKGTSGYVLIVEGAVPTGARGEYCTVWPGTTIEQAVKDFAVNVGYIIAVGTCATYGGIPGGNPNPTGVLPLSQILLDKTVVNIPGCPAHPDWIVGTIAYILENNGAVPDLDEHNRPLLFFENTTHQRCLYKESFPDPPCLFHRGCKGPYTYEDCPTRKWNGGAANTPGVNWCVEANNHCIGCTQPDFPDGMSPFYETRIEGAALGQRATLQLRDKNSGPQTPLIPPKENF